VSPHAFLALIFEGQDGLVELAEADAISRQPTKRVWVQIGDLGQAELGTFTYFGPIARRVEGSRRDDLQSSANVVWADIDSPVTLREIRDSLARADLEPSVTVFSGRGHWVYFKLTNSVRLARIEQINRTLQACLSGDGVSNANRLARLPGSFNHQGNRYCQVITTTPRTYTAGDFPAEPPDELEPLTGPIVPIATIAALTPALLTQGRWNYIQAHPKKGQVDRSEEEQKIFLALVHQGWSDEQIIRFADEYRLPKHIEEKMRRKSNQWTELSISKARSYAAVHPYRGGVCREGVTYRHLDSWDVLRCVRGQTATDLVNEVASRHGCSIRTVERAKADLYRRGYIARRADGRHVFYDLTAKGRETITSRFRPAHLYATQRRRSVVIETTAVSASPSNTPDLQSSFCPLAQQTGCR
jgi:DNA-binding MarR family transcriptional regulator